MCSELLPLQKLCSPFLLDDQLLAFWKKIGRAVSYPQNELALSLVLLVYVTGLRAVRFGINWMKILPKLFLAAGRVFGSPGNFCLRYFQLIGHIVPSNNSILPSSKTTVQVYKIGNIAC